MEGSPSAGVIYSTLPYLPTVDTFFTTSQKGSFYDVPFIDASFCVSLPLIFCSDTSRRSSSRPAPSGRRLDPNPKSQAALPSRSMPPAVRALREAELPAASRLKRCNLDLGTSLLGKRIFLLLELVEQISRYDSSDSTGSSQPDCLSVSSGFVTDQYVLGAPSGHRRPDSVPTRAHVARVREHASYWEKAGVRVLATRSDRGEP
ncbi:hypothetical protein E5676_scaffold609G00550 [Cucumis melo var. makuwa]|uniref:Uncharacterized protein n=1 Tax=Cucumis melo var. makuwa TaxID=1194695 RepID=A0A5D3DCV7_CUCMM|nr:hypothetical protein E5676_scaffold609G00550 [Cucumis melo var. makuwa]